MAPMKEITVAAPSLGNDRVRADATPDRDPAIALVAGIILGGLAYYLYKELEK